MRLRPNRWPAEAGHQGDNRGRQSAERIGGDVGTLEDMDEYLVTYTEYEQ